MNSFGLGLVLNFVDNASSGMGRATGAFQQMSATADAVSTSVSSSISNIVSASYALDNVGSTLMNAGSSIISLYGNVSQSVIDAGMQMQGYRAQLSALYGSIEAGENKMEEIKQYAMSSVFDIQSLIPAVTTMKAVGIEAMSEITTSSGKHTQKLLDYASDLAAMMPNMRNAYGTGVSAAMGAFKEYIAEGNAMSLKRGAGLDITQILGEDKGSTIEARTQQVADLIEQLNVVGYTAQLAGTPTQRLSNMEDALFNSLTKIADSGVFEKYCNLLEKLSNWVFSLVENEETFNVITGVLADTVTTLLSPLESLLDFLIENGDAIINWIKENPKLTKNILLTVAAIGGLLVAGGALLKLIATLGFAVSGLSTIKSLPLMLSDLFKTLGAALGGFLAKAIPLVAIASVLYYAWSKNIMGIRDKVTSSVKKIIETFSLISDAFTDNTLSEESFQRASELGILPLIENILDLKYRFEFFKQGFIDGWKEIYDKVSAFILPIASALKGSIFQPLIDKALEFLDIFASSDTQAWYNFGKSFSDFSFLPDIGGFILEIIEFVGQLIDRVLLLSGGTLPSVWNLITTIFSAITRVLPIVGSIIGTIFNVISNLLFPIILDIIDLILPFITGTTTSLNSLIGGVITVIVNLLENIVPIINSLIKLLIPLLKDIWNFLKPIIAVVLSIVANIVSRLVPILKTVLSTIAETIRVGIQISAPIIAAIIKIVSAIVKFLSPIIQKITIVIGHIINFILDIVEVVVNVVAVITKVVSKIIEVVVKIVGAIVSFIKNLVSIIVGIVRSIVEKIVAIVNGIVSVAQAIWSFISGIFNAVVNFFMTYIFPIIAKVVEIVMKVIEIVMAIVGVIVDWIKTNVIDPIASFFVDLWNSIVEKVTAFVESAKEVIMPIVEWINTNIITPVAEFFSNLWSDIVEGVTTFIEDAKEVFLTIVSWISENIITPISDFFTGLWEDIEKAFNTVADTVSDVLKGAINAVLGFVCNMINGVVKGINWAIDVINAIPGVSITKLELLEVPKLAEGGVVDKPTVAQIGEDGDEAVVPLKNNTEWIDKVVDKVAPRLNTAQYKSKSTTNESKGDTYDYSVTFSAGSVVIQLVNATEAELEKAADRLMKIIERKQQLKKMAVRA